MVARAHKTLIWERHLDMLRLRNALREFFPAALAAFGDLTGAHALELLRQGTGSRSRRHGCTPWRRSQRHSSGAYRRHQRRGQGRERSAAALRS